MIENIEDINMDDKEVKKSYKVKEINIKKLELFLSKIEKDEDEKINDKKCQ
jgi:hypothetical protein